VEATIHDADDRLVLASCGQVYITLLHLPLTYDGAVRLGRESKRLAHAFDGKMCSLAIIEPSAASSPPPEVRELTTGLTTAHPLLGAAIVIEGSGFRAAATRTVVAGMYLISKKRYPHKIVQTAREGAAWLVPLLSGAGVRSQKVADLVAAVELARGALRQKS